MTEKTQPDVRPGQVWADNDARVGTRLLRVEALTWKRGVPSVECVRVHPFTHCQVSERRTTIAVRRFKPTSTGYRLVKDVPGATA